MDEARWTPLLDGNSLNGWHSYGRSGVGDAWEVRGEALHLNTATKQRAGAKGGDLVTDAAFGNFHLKLEWKIAKGGNSGLLFYVQEELGKYDKSWQSGPEIQLLDNALHSDAMIPKRRAGDLYDLLSATGGSIKPAGEWNQLQLICEEGRLQVYHNDEQALNTQLWGETWQQLIRDSKFKDIPAFGSYKRGHLALQDHGDEVWFRNILIKEL